MKPSKARQRPWLFVLSKLALCLGAALACSQPPKPEAVVRIGVIVKLTGGAAMFHRRMVAYD